MDPQLYPPETVDLDVTDVPASIANALEEAITCHAVKCYTAAAMLVRKSLEQLCVEQGITTGNLKDKVKNLGAKITVPQALLNGVDNLRLLGNDAAHVESQAFNGVGEAEVDAALGLAKELVRATYQMESVVKRLEALKK